jgi:hypothetical protein
VATRLAAIFRLRGEVKRILKSLDELKRSRNWRLVVG